MQRQYLLPESGQFYKSNLHTHTIISDGEWTPEEVKEQYKRRGYSIIAYTDHNTYAYHADLCDDNFLALAALEVNIDDFPRHEDDWQRLKVYHLNFYDTRPWGRTSKSVPLPQRRYHDMDYINSYIATMAQEGFICCYNHPWWSMQDCRDYIGLRGLFAMEIYNYGCEHDGLYGYAPQAYDEMLRAGCRIGCLSTDDNHDRFPVGHPLNDSFGGFTMIKAQDLSYSTIARALQDGHYYASMGPEIHGLYLEGKKLVVDCSPVEKIYVMTEGRDGYKSLAKPGETITHAEFELSGQEGYVRVDCRDGHGLHANSNAYFLDKLL